MDVGKVCGQDSIFNGLNHEFRTLLILDIVDFVPTVTRSPGVRNVKKVYYTLLLILSRKLSTTNS